MPYITFNRFGIDGGRLGNQFFQFAALFHITKKYDYQLILPNTPASFFGICPNQKSFISDAVFDKTTFHTIELATEHTRTYDALIAKIEQMMSAYPERHLNLNGYFQSYKFFESERANLTPFLLPKKPFPYTQNTIGMHMRFTDYMAAGIPDWFARVTPNYYTDAINTINEETKSFHDIHTFSDDPIVCSKFVEQIVVPNRIVIHHGTEFSDFINLHNTQHHIITNSSYSWWAANLTPPDKKTHIVCAPKNWFGPKNLPISPEEEIHHPDWIKIPNG